MNQIYVMNLIFIRITITCYLISYDDIQEKKEFPKI